MAMVAGWNVPPASRSASNRNTGADAMSNQIQSVRGRVMRHASRYLLLGLLILGATWASSAMAAASTLKNISYDALPGGSVELHMDFGAGPVPAPQIFTTGNPPRIAVDFPDTSNAAARHLDIGKGSTSGVSAVSAGGRTRVVVELMRESTYRSRVEGHSLVLTVNNGTANQSVTTAATIDPTKRLPSSSDGPAISGIDFRRGPNGEGRVLISFSGSGAQRRDDAPGRQGAGHHRSRQPAGKSGATPGYAGLRHPGAIDQYPRRQWRRRAHRDQHQGQRQYVGLPDARPVRGRGGPEERSTARPTRSGNSTSSRATAASASPSTSRTSRCVRRCS